MKKLNLIITLSVFWALLAPAPARSEETLTEFALKEAMSRLNTYSYSILLDDLNDYWKETKGVELGGDFEKFSERMDIGNILTALEVGENIYSGDYKAATGTTELAVLTAYVPVSEAYLVMGKALDSLIQSLNTDIFNANTKKVYTDLYKADPSYFDRAGVDKFYDYLYAPGKDKLKLRAWFYEYAKNVNNELPENWAVPANREASKTQVRVAINTLRRDMSKLREIEEKKKELAEQRKTFRAQLNNFQKFVDELNSPSTKQWIMTKVKQLETDQDLSQEIPKVSASIVETFNQFLSYYNYFMHMVDSNQAVTVSRRGGEFDGGPGCTCPSGVERRALSSGASYSLKQARQLGDKFQSLADDWRLLMAQLEKMSDKNVLPQNITAMMKNADKINNEYFVPEDRVSVMLDEMNAKLDELDLGERDVAINADTIPDGLDPVFVPNILGLDTVPASTPK